MTEQKQKEKKSEITKSSMRQIFIDAGCTMISEEAIDELKDILRKLLNKEIEFEKAGKPVEIKKKVEKKEE